MRAGEPSHRWWCGSTIGRSGSRAVSGVRSSQAWFLGSDGIVIPPVGECGAIMPLWRTVWLGVDQHADHFADQGVVAYSEELGLVAGAVVIADRTIADLLDEDVELVVDATALVVQRFEVVLGPIGNDHG